MRIDVKCFATLARFQPPNARDGLELPQGATVAQAIETIGAPPDEVAVIFVNGRGAAMDTALSQGDRLGLFPAVGGG